MNKTLIYPLCLMLCLMFSSCDNSDERTPIQTIPMSHTPDEIFTNGDDYHYIISRHELYYSKLGWIAYKTEKPNDHYTLYVYEPDNSIHDGGVYRFVATNEVMFNKKMRSGKMMPPYGKIVPPQIQLTK
jgi:hypothetical protein